jgi:hypothetical protein
MVHPQEVVVCSKGCKQARRTSLADAWVIVTRSGEKTSTTYNFGVGEIEPLDDEIKPLDFPTLSEFQPLSAPEMAAKLGVQNPFRKSDTSDHTRTGSRPSVDDDDETDEVAQVFKR